MASSETTNDMEEQVIPDGTENEGGNKLPQDNSRPPGQPHEGVSSYFSAVTSIHGETQHNYDLNRRLFKGYSILAVVLGALMCVMVWLWVIEIGGLSWGTDHKTEVNLHMILMTTCMVYFQGIGIIVFRMLPAVPKLLVKLIHTGFHLIGLIGISVGLWSAVNTHYMKNLTHFYSIHSWIGIIAIGLFYVQLLSGLFVFRLYTPWRKSNAVISYHHVLGCFIFFAACSANLTGIMIKAVSYKTYKELPNMGVIINVSGVSCAVFCFIIMYQVLDPRFRRRSRPET